MNDFYCIFVLKLIMESSKLILYIQIMNKKMFKILLIVILLPMVQSAGQVAVGEGLNSGIPPTDGRSTVKAEAYFVLPTRRQDVSVTIGMVCDIKAPKSIATTLR